MARPVLKTELYTKTSKNQAKRVREDGFIPASVSSKGNTTNIVISEKELLQLLASGIKESTLIDLEIPQQEETVAFIKEIQS